MPALAGTQRLLKSLTILRRPRLPRTQKTFLVEYPSETVAGLAATTSEFLRRSITGSLAYVENIHVVSRGEVENYTGIKDAIRVSPSIQQMYNNAKKSLTPACLKRSTQT
jgi:hypothetical protein